MFDLLIAVVLLGGALIYLKLRNQAIDETWRNVARQLKMRARPGGMLGQRRLTGARDGVRFVIETGVRGGDEEQLEYTRYEARFPSLRLGLKLRPADPRLRPRKGLVRDIETGDVAFDKAVVVHGKDPARVLDFLTPERRYRILRALRLYPDCVITDTRIRCSKPGVEENAQRLEGRIRHLVKLAVALAGPTRIEPALEAKRRGALDRALTEVRAEEDDRDARVLEAETLRVGERRDEAAAVLAQVDDDPDAEALAAEPAPLPPPPAPAPGPSAAEACADLFGAGATSVEIGRKFDAEYAGREVRWSGTLVSVAAYASDFVFGADPGARAVLELAEVEQGYFGLYKVQGVLQLPPDAEAALASRIGERISFAGRLLRVDPFVRNLFVADAALVNG